MSLQRFIEFWMQEYLQYFKTKYKHYAVIPSEDSLWHSILHIE